MNRTLIITLFLLINIAAPMIAMQGRLQSDGSNPFKKQLAAENVKIRTLLHSSTTLPIDAPLTDELLLKENPWWQEACQWPQDEKNMLLRKAMDAAVCEYAQFQGQMALAIAIGADPKIKSLKTSSTTALAMSLGQDDPVLARYLIGKGASLDKEIAKSFLTKTKKAQMAELLLECGAPIPEKILFDRQLPAEVMAVYLKRGVKPQQSSDGQTPLHRIADRSIWGGVVDPIAKATMLIQAGVNLEAQDANGTTALHFAARENKVELCKTIIDGCIEIRRKYQTTMIALLHCTGNTRWRPAFQGGGQLPKLPRDIVKGPFRQLLKPPHMCSPFKLLSIKNVNGYIPYELFPRAEREKVEEFMNPERFAPKK